MSEVDKQREIKHDHLKAFQWKKGQSGNIMGRPPGKTMKEYARQYLERMTDEERDEWLEGLPKDVIWEMSEGKAKQDVTARLNLTISDVLDELDNGQKTQG